MSSLLVIEEIARGEGVSLSQAARRLPSNRGGRPVHTSCILRWISGGIRLADGRVVRLEAARVAGRWLTSEGALQRFIAAQTPDTSPIPSIRTPGQRRRASERAARALDKLGI
jgi:hypothetical protein